MSSDDEPIRSDGETRAEARSQAVIDSLPAHIAVIRPDGTVIAANLAWNRAAADGMSPLRPAVGQNYLQSLPQGGSEWVDLWGGTLAVIQGTVEQYRGEYPLSGPEGLRWFLVTVSPLRAGQGAVVSHLDITTRKQDEEALRQRTAKLDALAQSLRRSNEELDQFAYITSHDLRAPLRGIANLSSWVEEDMGDRFTPEAHHQMEMLRGRVRRMEAMIDGILEYSRVGRVRTEEQEIDVAALLADVVDLLDPPPDMTIEVQPGMPVLIGEKLRLQQVFMNLISNAIKHNKNPDGRVKVGWRETGEFYEFSVSDNGPGIDPRYHEKVFVIFQTLEARDKVEGTGVGLSLVKKIVEHFGGKVSLDSQPGHGARFAFTWPKRTATRPARSSAAELGGGPRERVGVGVQADAAKGHAT